MISYIFPFIPIYYPMKISIFGVFSKNMEPIFRIRWVRRLSDIPCLREFKAKLPSCWKKPERTNITTTTGWWYTYPSEKWWSSSVGMMTFPIYGKIMQMFQATNQIPYYDILWPRTPRVYQLRFVGWWPLVENARVPVHNVHDVHRKKSISIDQHFSSENVCCLHPQFSRWGVFLFFNSHWTW